MGGAHAEQLVAEQSRQRGGAQHPGGDAGGDERHPLADDEAHERPPVGAERVARQHGPARFGTLILGALSGAALLLAAVGVYGIVAFVVAIARREIALRVALGADGGTLVRLIVRNGMALVATGVAAGVLGAAALARLLRDQLFGVRAADPLTWAAVLLAVLAAGLAATWLPARRAARVDPQLALRSD